MRRIKVSKLKELNSYPHVDDTVIYFARERLPAFPKKVLAAVNTIWNNRAYPKPRPLTTVLNFKLC